MNKMTALSISTKDAISLIKDKGLKTIQNSWHFNYNIEIFYEKCGLLYDKINEIVYLDYKNLLGPWSPLPIWTLDGNAIPLHYSLQEIDITPNEDTFYFWRTITNNFDDYLNIRTKRAKKQNHFPTISSYNKLKNNENIRLMIFDFNLKNYSEIERNQKADWHAGAATYLQHPGVGWSSSPEEWKKMAYLYHEDEVVATAPILVDNNSISLLNTTAKRTKYSYGVILCCEIIKWCCENGKMSFDCGISKVRGCYKQKSFLDCIGVYGK